MMKQKHQKLNVSKFLNHSIKMQPALTDSDVRTVYCQPVGWFPHMPSKGLRSAPAALEDDAVWAR